MRRSLLFALALTGLASTAPLTAQAPASLPDSTFAQLVARLSEPAGFFDTDNLISNEDSYLHVVGTLKRIGVAGGAYIGVGPDQNFSYIAAIKPRVAFIVDIRRDNLLQHLLFKSLFALSRNRIEYLSLLFGVSAPSDSAGWGARDIGALLAYVDVARKDTTAAARIRARARARVLERARQLPIPLREADIATIARFHDAFITQGPSLRFNTFGRAPQSYYPDYRRLLTETDRTRRQSNYLAHEADFQVVKSLQDRNLVIPIVGNFGGEKALPAVAQWLRSQRETVSAFYTSNVEQYLFRDGAFNQFARSVAQLPRDSRTVMLRSYFQGSHPQRVDGYHATQVAQRMDRFVALHAAGSLLNYFLVVTRDLIDPP